jgi:hypothetical protein
MLTVAIYVYVPLDCDTKYPGHEQLAIGEGCGDVTYGRGWNMVEIEEEDPACA